MIPAFTTALIKRFWHAAGAPAIFPSLRGARVAERNFFRGVCIPILDYLIQFQFKIVGVMNISFFLIFYHLIRLLVKALQCELVIFQKELFCGDSLVVDALMEKYQIIGKLCLTKQGDCIEQFCVLFPVLKETPTLWRNSELVLR